MAELYPFKVGIKVASWHILGRKLAILATYFDLNLFGLSFPLILRSKPIGKPIGPKLTISVYKTEKWPYFKIPGGVRSIFTFLLFLTEGNGRACTKSLASAQSRDICF